MHLIRTLVFFLFTVQLYGADLPVWKEYSELKLSELTLKNGMRVVLKQTDDDEDEVIVRLVAMGGFASLTPEERASGELAPEIVLESGIGDFSADKLSALLYQKSIDFNLKIEPFTREIDASLSEEGLEILFDIINKTFVSPQLNQEALANVVKEKKNEWIRKGNDSCSNEFLNLISVNEAHALKSLCSKDLEKIDLSLSKKFFEEAFSNPEDFVCVIVGQFDLQNTKRLIDRYLASIPSKSVERKFLLPTYREAPKTTASKIQNLPNSSESIVRLGFPLQLKLDKKKLEQLELVCQIIEFRLRNTAKNRGYEAKGIDAWYEQPLYPSLEYPWISIQFHVDNKNIKTMTSTVLDELKTISKKGFTPEEIKLAAKFKKQGFELWKQSNDFWIVLLTNNYLWNWDPQNIVNKFDAAVMNKEELQEMVHSALPVEEYTLKLL